MGPYETTDLAIAVTNAGGMGVVSHPAPSAETLKRMIEAGTLEGAFDEVMEKVRSAILNVKAAADGPFGINLRVAPEQPEVPAVLDMIIEEREKDAELASKLKLIITSAGNPAQPYLEKIKEARMLWFHNVPSVYHARKAQGAGVDALIATGYEAGGHVAYEPVHTMVLVPEVVKNADVPVVAGGGICDGKGLVAALAMGAAGIYMGTRFIATEECEFNRPAKEAIISASDRFGKEAATFVTQGFFGPLRHLKNKYSLELDKIVKGDAPTTEVFNYELLGSQLAFGPKGDVENGAIWCGQVAIRLKDILTASEVIERVMEEAESTLKELSQKYL